MSCGFCFASYVDVKKKIADKKHSLIMEIRKFHWDHGKGSVWWSSWKSQFKFFEYTVGGDSFCLDVDFGFLRAGLNLLYLEIRKFPSGYTIPTFGCTLSLSLSQDSGNPSKIFITYGEYGDKEQAWIYFFLFYFYEHQQTWISIRLEWQKENKSILKENYE